MTPHPNPKIAIFAAFILLFGLGGGAYFFLRVPFNPSPAQPITVGPIKIGLNPIAAQPLPTASAIGVTSLVLIIERVTASTNVPAFTFTIYIDGSATLVYTLTGTFSASQFPNSSVPPGTLNLTALKQDMALLEYPATIPISTSCPKSVSFGTVSKVTYSNETSGDISCAADTTGKKLYTDISALRAQMPS